MYQHHLLNDLAKTSNPIIFLKRHALRPIIAAAVLTMPIHVQRIAGSIVVAATSEISRNVLRRGYGSLGTGLSRNAHISSQSMPSSSESTSNLLAGTVALTWVRLPKAKQESRSVSNVPRLPNPHRSTFRDKRGGGGLTRISK